MNKWVIPETMKTADIVQLFKNKERTAKTNYKPISLLITMSKVLQKQTVSFLEQYNLLYKSKYGFRYTHSCSDAIMKLTSEILKGNENKLNTTCAFLVLSKAFATSDPKILLENLNNYGLRGTVRKWFESYLQGRRL